MTISKLFEAMRNVVCDQKRGQYCLYDAMIDMGHIVYKILEKHEQEGKLYWTVRENGTSLSPEEKIPMEYIKAFGDEDNVKCYIIEWSTNDDEPKFTMTEIVLEPQPAED